MTTARGADAPARPNRASTYTSDDFPKGPFVAFYELTRACDLLCKHCRACAQYSRHPGELSTELSRLLLEQFADFEKPPVVVFTGGDPLKRPDVCELIRYGVNKGLDIAITPSATPLLTKDAILKMRDSGLSRLALSIDGSDEVTHDSFRGVSGSFQRTLQALADARAAGVPVQVNTTITSRNDDQIDSMADLMEDLGVVLWSVFFLVPVGRGLAEQRIAPDRYEYVFERLWEQSKIRKFGIKTTEAHHYRRFVLQRDGDPQRSPGGLPPGRIQRAPLGVNDGKGVMFVSHTGAIYPTGFMPIFCGRFPVDSLKTVYQESPLFQSLRDGDRLQGKCGLCEYRHICGGSRARAFALTRNPLAAEPDCAYIPSAMREVLTCSV